MTVPPGFPRAYVAPAPTALTRGGYQLCDGCSHGMHTKHAPLIRCDCDLPGCAKETP
jgi:hypothetical protein